MHILLIPVGLILWFLAYNSKPINNDDVTFLWEEEKYSKRLRLSTILRDSFYK